MHIMEGYLPPEWCLVWYIVAIPVVIWGIKQIKDVTAETDASKPLLALSGAFIFILSSLKMPSVTGSCSHPCGNGLSAALFGPAVTSVLCVIVLVFQALLLAHGGLTTLGANTVSMGIVGPFLGYLVWKGMRKANISPAISIFFTAFVADFMTYITTSVELAAFPLPNFGSAFLTFIAVFAVTQLPLAIAEGVLTVVIFNYILKERPDILLKLHVINESDVKQTDNIAQGAN